MYQERARSSMYAFVFTMLVVVGVLIGFKVGLETASPDQPVAASEFKAAEIEPVNPADALTASLEDAGQTVLTAGGVLVGVLVGGLAGAAVAALLANPVAAALTSRKDPYSRYNSYRG